MVEVSDTMFCHMHWDGGINLASRGKQVVKYMKVAEQSERQGKAPITKQTIQPPTGSRDSRVARVVA